MKHSHARIAAVFLLVALATGCAAGRAYRRGEGAARVGDWDTAVVHFQEAVQEDPEKPEFRIALQRAMISASIAHLDQARVLEARGDLDNALREYRRASELDPPNRQVAGKVTELERKIRDQIEAARARPSLQQLRDTARQGAPPPLFNLNEVVAPLVFNNSSLRDILTTIGKSTGINVTFEGTYSDRTYSVQLENLTLAEALQQILAANQLFYKVVNQRTILVIPDNQQKRNQYEERLVQTFFISHADPLELAALANSVVRVTGAQIQPPAIVGNKSNNTIIAQATVGMMDIIERFIASQDKPRAEVVIDVQILEVSRQRTKQLGLDLGSYALSAVFSPEVDPRDAGDTGAALVPRPFNANTVSRGISTADFYLAVPSAVVRFLESDGQTKVIAKPQLRGAEGVALKLNLGEDIPILSTSFTPIAQGGANFNPLTSYNYRTIGVKLEMTPRVTYEDEIVLDLYVENSTPGQGVEVGDTVAPTFFTRNVTTRLRLREGESTLLAGLLQDNERKSLTGFPGLLRIPIIRQLFSASDSTVVQTDIVMLLTPRIVRTHELTPQDVSPIYIGTLTNLGLTGPPPLIALDGGPAGEVPVGGPVAPGAPAGATPGAALLPPGAVTPALPPAAAAPVPGAPTPAVPPAPPGVAVIPPGSSPVPGTTSVPAAAVAQGAASGQVILSPPSSELRVGSGPYTVPVQITGASQISSISLTVTYNPTVLRLRATTEGSFMRTGGTAATFTQQPDAAGGRIDIAIVRTGDVTGVAGTGLLAALLFDAIGAGPANLAVTATATAPAGAPVPLQFAQVPPVTVR
jgi:type II secretory pathway component GspD/PulD (secretin)